MADEQDYQRLRQTVTNLLVRIEENQQIQSRFQDFEFQLLSCRRIPELMEKILDGARQHFELLSVSLVLYDPDYAIKTLFEDLEINDWQRKLQLRHSDEFFVKLYHHSPQVRLGPLDVLTASRLFPGIQQIGSAALLPLMRQDRQIGSLHFASPSADRYSPDKASSFMWHLASMVAICLENCFANEQLKRQGQEDILTSVRNRRSFEEEYLKELERAERGSQPLTCMFIDIDHFKNINDSYGHQTGDQCLRKVARLINEELRKTDLLARYGGEEFVCLLPRCHLEEAVAIAERVRLRIANNPLVPDESSEKIPMTVSIGLSCWHPNDKRIVQSTLLGQKLLATADKAMYNAKQSGRNRVCTAEFNSSELMVDSSELKTENASISR